jgi:hypothetical protein
MQSALTHRQRNPSGGDVIPVFRVVIAYEDFRAATRAQRAYDFLRANLTHAWQVTSQRWKFELLRIPALRKMAIEDAAKADLIIIACHGDRELPGEVDVWMETWRGLKAGAVALIALLDYRPEQAEQAQATRARLESVAQRAQMDFYLWPQWLPRQESLVADQPSETLEEPLLEAV